MIFVQLILPSSLICAIAGKASSVNVAGSAHKSCIMDSEQLAMSIAYLKKRIVSEDSDVSESQCLARVHVCLKRLGIAVSSSQVDEIFIRDRKVSNVVTDIKIQTVQPIKCSQVSRPQQLLVNRQSLFPGREVIASFDSEAKEDKTAVVPSQVMNNYHNQVLAKQTETAVDSVTVVVSLLMKQARLQISLAGRGSLINENSLVLTSLFQMGLPPFKVNKVWQSYSRDEFVGAIKHMAKVNHLTQFERSIDTFAQFL